jgi:hypothetical protein
MNFYTESVALLWTTAMRPSRTAATSVTVPARPRGRLLSWPAKKEMSRAIGELRNAVDLRRPRG